MAKGQGGRPLERKCLSSSDFKEKIILKFVDISLPNHILLFHSSGFKGGKSPQIAKSQRNGKNCCGHLAIAHHYVDNPLLDEIHLRSHAPLLDNHISCKFSLNQK